MVTTEGPSAKLLRKLKPSQAEAPPTSASRPQTSSPAGSRGASDGADRRPERMRHQTSGLSFPE